MQPLLIGLAVDGLLDSSVRGLLLFAMQHLLLTVTVASRRMHCTRVFTTVQSDLLMREGFIDCDHRAAEAATRMERTIPDRLQRIVLLSGSLLLLGWYDLTLVPFCLLLMVPFGLLWAASEPRISQIASRLKEEQQTLTDEQRPVEGHRRQQTLLALRTLRVRLEDAAAIRNALTELFILVMLASAIVHFLGCGDVSPPAGEIIAVLGYLLVFVTGLRVGCVWNSRGYSESRFMD